MCSEGHEAAERDDKTANGAYVLAFLLPAVHEDGKEEGGEHEFDAASVEGQAVAEACPGGSGENPVAFVEQGNEEVVPAPVHTFGHMAHAEYGECFVDKPVDEVRLEFPRISVPVQHGNAVKQVPGVDDKADDESRERSEGAGQHAGHDEFKGSCEDGERHQDGKDGLEPQ